MKLRHFFAAAVVMTTFSSSSYGFMADDAASNPQNDSLATLVDGLKTDIAEGKVECKAILNKINTAVEAIDARLDAGVADETEYLATRESLLEMRADLPCLSEELANAGLGESVLSEKVIAEQTIGSEIIDNNGALPLMNGGAMDGAFVGGGYAGGGYAGGGMVMGGGGGGGGGLLGGGSGIGGIGMLGAIGAAVAIPLATDDDNPGIIVSPSTGN